ncbi:MAG: 30S ribosomal protein S6 [Dehalococcoidia bacterium]|jgi:small subunit ribosomal protein S6|nr:30S ribosomal protein S6 [Dehalococcoidia bacterium]
MSSYELVLIISPEVVDEEMPDFITKLSELVNKVGGSVDEVNQWGRRKLAYPIKRSMEGNYVLTKVKMKPALTKELEANLRLSGKILRHLLIKSAD